LKIKGYKVEGLKKFPVKGPVIIAANHLSAWDPVLVACALDRQVFYMGKEQLFDVPIFGKYLLKVGVFPVKRGHSDIRAIRKSLDILKNGKVLGVFPEGTRLKTGEIQDAMSGIVLIMEKSKAPVVPIKVYGTVDFLKTKRGNSGVIIGDPIYPGQINPPENADNSRLWIANEIMKIVKQI